MSESLLYANGVAASLSNTFLSKDTLNRMIDARSATEALSILQETSFGQGIVVDSPFDVEKLIDVETTKLLNFIKIESPNDVVRDFLLLPYDYNNLAIVCKSLMLSQNADEYFEAEGKYEFAMLKDSVLAKRFDDFKNEFIKKALNEFQVLASKPNVKGYQVDFLFKNYLYQNLKYVAKKDKLLSQLITLKIDVENLACAMRSTTQFYFDAQVLCGGSLDRETLFKVFKKDKSATNAISSPILLKFAKFALSDAKDSAFVNFEIYKNNFMLDILKQNKYDIESLSPFILYCMAKTNEIKNVRLIMSYKNNDLTDNIKKRFLECYGE